MKKKLLSIALAAVATGLSVAAVAALNDQLRGSDTLESMTDFAVANCAGVTTLVYVGGGSSNGEDALRKAEQAIAPMSRALQDSRTCRGPNPAESENLVVALDGIAITHSASECASDGIAYATTSCFRVDDRNATAGIDCGVDCTTNDNGTPGNTTDDFQQYCVANERDVLRLVFSGLQKTGGNSLANMKCDGDVRRSLVAQYAELFDGGCAGSACTSLKHAWRRDDLSGTTDTFLTLLGLPAILSSTGVLQKPFCNGTASEDLDPIRVACDAADNVCDINGTSGLVLPVFVPEVAPVDAGDEYPTQACSTGKFALKAALQVQLGGGAFDYVCPEGTQFSVASFCLAPYTDLAVDEFNCVNARTNNSVFTAGKDGRVFNKWVRKANGALVVDRAGRPEINAYYRVRTAACDEISSTLNIGCLAGNYACTLGFAGREAVETVGLNSKGLAVKGVFPTITDIRKLISGDPTAYPLARFLYVNTHVGFENVTDAQESALASCFADQAQADAAASSAGFVTLGQAPFCQDFNEVGCNGDVFNCDSNSDCNFVGKGVCVGGNPSTTPALEGTCDQTCTASSDCLQPGRTCIAGRCDYASNNNACL